MNRVAEPLKEGFLHQQRLRSLLGLQIAICVGWSLVAPARFSLSWFGLVYGTLTCVTVGYVIFLLAWSTAKILHYMGDVRFPQTSAVTYVGAERPKFDRAFVKYALGLTPVTVCLQIGAAHLSQSLGLAEVLNRVVG